MTLNSSDPVPTILPFKLRIRNARHALYELLPFVKRKRYRKCKMELEAAQAAIIGQQHALQRELQPIYTTLLSLPASFAHKAHFEWLKQPPGSIKSTELCLFVTYAPAPALKMHVVDHIGQLVAEGIHVLLIVNTDLKQTQLQLPADLLTKLHACAIRENIGYDFGAWAHAYSLIDSQTPDRLYLVNDSVIGPLDNLAYSSMIERIRNCDADFIGLTQNPYLKWHLQSFFLVANKQLLQSDTFADLMHTVVNLPTKEAVINLYEIQISSFLAKRGFRCKAIFPHLDPDSPGPDDTHERWDKLIENGFPFIKASVLKRIHAAPEAQRLIPQKYRDIAQG